jgi:3-phenylpropionate/trans-cinnamate dioxygenase ferredoxin subunit
MGRHVVATTDELPPGSRKIVELHGRRIGVFNVGGRLFALRSRCPHMGASLCEGIVSNAVSSSRPGEVVWDAEAPMLRCPWHGWEFDMRTGKSWCDPEKLRVKRYEVTREPGPFVAETYRVERDQDAIVIEV